jgi:hypothetical protein
VGIAPSPIFLRGSKQWLRLPSSHTPLSVMMNLVATVAKNDIENNRIFAIIGKSTRNSPGIAFPHKDYLIRQIKKFSTPQQDYAFKTIHQTLNTTFSTCKPSPNFSIISK